MKKILALGMLGLMIAAAFALGTSATFRDYRVNRSLHIDVVTDDSELIDLTPVQPYAYINDRGKLVIDFSKNNPNWPGNPNSPYFNASWNNTDLGSGLSKGSRYNFDEIFNVSNHLWEDMNITVRVVSSSSNIRFYNPDGKIYVTGTSNKPIDSDSAVSYDAKDVCFVLTPGDAVSIGMEINAGQESYDATITIYAYPEGDEDFVCGPGGV
ncbi:hypothetical protein CDI07_00310 [Thermococcus sp. 5-4]|nr:hypothetical protein CDI07_00310 [Thermococcus sp. 5-4]